MNNRATMLGVENCMLENVNLDLYEEYKNICLNEKGNRGGGYYQLGDIWCKNEDDDLEKIRKLVKEEFHLLEMFNERQEWLKELFDDISEQEIIHKYKLHFKDFLRKFKNLNRGIMESSLEEMVR